MQFLSAKMNDDGKEDDDIIEVSTVTWIDSEPPNAELAIDTISEHFFDKII